MILLAVSGVAGVASLLLEMKRDLMMMQQNSYRNERYMRWLRTSGDTTSSIRLAALIVFFFTLMPQVGFIAGIVCSLLLFVFNILKLTTAKYKKPLVWTPRARRIYGVALVIALLISAIAVLLVPDVQLLPTLLVALFLVSHVVMMAAIVVLQPVENHINKGFYDDAARILRSMPDLKVIGITGSYGKTSTKHYLNRILQEQWDVLMTPGSYNTTMGVIRTVREMMKPYTEIFICEMGAKNIGDIKEICDLVHPQIGIITAVGEQHLESFKTIENVQRTKFELADAIPADGFVMVNNDFEYAASRKVDNTLALRYAIGSTDVDYYATDITYGKNGSRFNLHTPDGNVYPFETRLVGECNISNLLPAIAIALRLGMPVEKVQFAVGRVEQVEHRLNMKQTPGGITIIDDAFNSNPHGSRMALDVLRAMTSGKRIIITPGMIELGSKQWEANEAFGRHIAECADIAIVVGEYNRDAILSGLRDGGMPEERVHAVDTFAQAQQTLARCAASGDTVLYENDLPDTFK
jgi:UDP-N-acetylmuramoyl-tripeptide--D-alanyl-D-alanine ligase